MSARPRLTIDLAALAQNYRRLQLEAPAAEMAAVVKADAYGLGLARVARTLAAAGARTFFVADVEEATALRAILPRVAIYVLGGYAVGARDAFAASDLRPVLNTPEQVRAFSRLPAHARPRAALQVDSGMTRLGLTLDALAGMQEELANLELDWLISHLACADDPASAFSRGQRARFEQARELVPMLKASLANSAGVFLGADFHYDLCRPGIAVYGGNPRPGHANPMTPVVTLDAEILQVYELTAEARVGYGATWRAPAGARIATAAVGYGDGILRCAGNRATARFAGVEVPLAGRVSMDLVGLDVSAVPSAAAVEGARVELIWGPDGLDRLAEATGTIPYEVLVRLGPRIERRYRGGE